MIEQIKAIKMVLVDHIFLDFRFIWNVERQRKTKNDNIYQNYKQKKKMKQNPCHGPYEEEENKFLSIENNFDALM